jgi:phosphomethylpyrimidine synthase
MIIGRNFNQVNANIGNSAVTSSIEEEVDKLVWSIRWGADTVMDLSTGENIHETREVDHAQLPVPIGFGADLPGAGKVNGKAEDLTWESSATRADRAGRAGRGLLHHPRRRPPVYVPLTAGDGHRLARWLHHGQVVFVAPGSFPYEHFETASAEIMKAYDICFSWVTACASARLPTQMMKRNL